MPSCRAESEPDITSDETKPSIVSLLEDARTVLCTVESCTGGAVAVSITDTPGSSRVFWGSFVTYDNSAKHAVLGVPLRLLQEEGAVSARVARAMAESGLKRMKAALAKSPSSVLKKPRRLASLATTGVAGPGGGTLAKPVGLCFIALARTDGKTEVREIRAPGTITRSRARTRAFFTAQALKVVKEIL